MGRNLRNIALGAIGGIIVILVLLFILPIDVVYEIKVDTRSYPSKEWKLIQEGGEFRTEEINFTGSPAANGKSYVFDRGDVIDIDFNDRVFDGAFVDRDSILLRFSSMMHNLRIQRALNEIEVQESLIIAGNAAMKRPQYEEAIDAVELAKSNVKLQEANYQRLSQLLSDGVISQFELDSQTNRLEVAKQELAIAEKRVVNTTFEQKPEDVAVFNTIIGNMDKELDVLLAQQSAYTLKSPFAGQVDLQPEPGVIMSLKDTTSISLLFPFPIDQRDYLKPNSVLEFEYEDKEIALSFSLQDQVTFIHGDQQCLGIARLNNNDFPIGELRTASVVCDTVLLRDYLLRKIL
ncbi:MAG: hypothetical protein HKN45_06620 [Flavobacteriales bacterium]|nr:hypothetical protein [Flavobacteriales bacterium]